MRYSWPGLILKVLLNYTCVMLWLQQGGIKVQDLIGAVLRYLSYNLKETTYSVICTINTRTEQPNIHQRERTNTQAKPRL